MFSGRLAPSMGACRPFLLLAIGSVPAGAAVAKMAASQRARSRQGRKAAQRTLAGEHRCGNCPSDGGAGGNTFLLVSPSGIGTAGPRAAEEQTRRLINLIFAGRNRMVMIRRELPRTRRAGWVRKPFRIEHRRVLLSVVPALPSALPSCANASSNCGLTTAVLLLGVNGDCPDEPEQLAA